MRPLLLAVIVILALFPSVAHSEVLGTAEFVHDSCSWAFDAYYSRLILHMTLGHMMPEVGYWESCAVEFPDWLNATDVGIVLTATPDSEGFPCMASNLTDGSEDLIGVWFYVPSKTSGISGIFEVEQESIAFSLSDTDFRDATITAISLRVDELTLEKCTSLSGTECIGIHCRVTMIVEGEWDDVATETTTWGRIKALYAE